MPRRSSARRTSKVRAAKGPIPPEPKHLAIRDEEAARAWLAGRDQELMVYVRALKAVRTILDSAKAAAPLTKTRKKVEAQLAKLRKTYPGFEFSMRPPPLPPFDATSLATDIVSDRTDAIGAEQVRVLAEFLAKLYVEQCTERFAIRWLAPTKPRGKDGFVTSAGRFQEDQLARVVMIGVAVFCDLRSLERGELPIVAVASGFDAPATQPDARLPAAFESRADTWRQESDVVATRLLTLLPFQFVKKVKPLVQMSASAGGKRKRKAGRGTRNGSAH